MRVLHEGDRCVHLGFGPEGERLDARLELHEGTVARSPADDDAYWKIGLTLDEVDLAHDCLIAQGIPVSAPAQFLDVGYLCHLRDPDGYAIELLQKDFEVDHRPRAATPGAPLGSTPTLGQITLRVPDADAALAFCRHTLGMRLLSRQVVRPHRFTLYFLAFTDEEPPDPNLDAVPNRPWLWRRPYTTLELQHRWEAPPPRTSADAGFEGVVVAPPGHRRAETLRGWGTVPFHLVPLP